MAEKFVELQKVVHSETDPIIHVWCFSCALCRTGRTAYLHESGVVSDVETGQPDDVENLVVASDGKTFLNLYLLENAKTHLEAQDEIGINQDIADLHAQSFHGLDKASVELAN